MIEKTPIENKIPLGEKIPRRGSSKVTKANKVSRLPQ